MKNLLVALALLASSVPAHAADIELRCLPTEAPPIQGAERFFRIGFPEAGGATLRVGSQVIEFVDMTGGARVLNARFSPSEGRAVALWGQVDISVSLMARGGGEWDGSVMFDHDESAGGIEFKAGTEVELRCKQ